MAGEVAEILYGAIAALSALLYFALYNALRWQLGPLTANLLGELLVEAAKAQQHAEARKPDAGDYRGGGSSRSRAHADRQDRRRI